MSSNRRKWPVCISLGQRRAGPSGKSSGCRGGTKPHFITEQHQWSCWLTVRDCACTPKLPAGQVLLHKNSLTVWVKDQMYWMELVRKWNCVRLDMFVCVCVYIWGVKSACLCTLSQISREFLNACHWESHFSKWPLINQPVEKIHQYIRTLQGLCVLTQLKRLAELVNRCFSLCGFGWLSVFHSKTAPVVSPGV